LHINRGLNAHFLRAVLQV